MKYPYTFVPAMLTIAGFFLIATEANATNWINQIGGRGADIVYAVTETSDGRLCASGTAWTGGRFGDGKQEVVLESEAAQQIFIACYFDNGDLDFVTPLVGGRADTPRAIAPLPGGDLLLTGLRENGDGNADVFLQRFDRQGGEVWSRAYGGALADSGNALSVALDGAIYLAAGFEDRLTWRTDERLAKLNSSGSRDAAVMRLTADGQVDWVRGFGGAGFDEAVAVQARRDGGVLVAGTFRGEMNVGAYRFQSRGFRDVVVAAYDTGGAVEWAVQFGGPGQDTVKGVVEDDRGQVHVVGNFHDRLRVAPDQELQSSGSTDVFVARLDAAGKLRHAASFGGALTDQVFDIAIDGANRLILAGHYQGVSDLAPGPRVARIDAPSPGNSSGFVLVLDEHSDYVDAAPIAGTGMEMVLGVHALRDGNVAVTGLFNRDLSIPGSGTSLDARGKTDIFVARIARPGRDLAARKNGLRSGELDDLPLSW